MTIDDLVIKPEFENLIPKLTEEENIQLEKNILKAKQVFEPIVTWGNVIIDGHHRYYILKKHPEIVNYEIRDGGFKDEHEAMIWACQNQLGRRNLSPIDASYLRGKIYSETKLAQGGTGANQYTKVQTGQNDQSAHGDTVDSIAKLNHVGRRTIQHDERFKRGVDIAEEILPGMKETILHGEVKPHKNVIEKLATATPDKQRKAVNAISNGETEKAKEILDFKEGDGTVKKHRKPKEPIEEPYNSDDMVEEIKAAASELHFALNQTLIVMHQDVLADEECRDKAKECLQKIVTDVQEFISKISKQED